MERPTCSTCPFWEDGYAEQLNNEVAGYCHRHAPQVPTLRTHGDGGEEATDTICHGVFVPPMTGEGYWCGEHPGFPAYIEGLKTPAPRTGPG
jgi:hypothetical protein